MFTHSDNLRMYEIGKLKIFNVAFIIIHSCAWMFMLFISHTVLLKKVFIMLASYLCCKDVITFLWMNYCTVFSLFISKNTTIQILLQNPFHLHGLTLALAWTNNHVPRKMWSEATHPFPNFNGCTIIPPKNSKSAEGDEWWSANALIYLNAFLKTFKSISL